MPENEQIIFKKIFSNWKTTVVLVIVLIFVLISLGKVTIKRYTIKKEINELKAEAERLETANLKLTETLNYLQSDFFKEQEARTKLELQKPDEKVIVVTPPKEPEKKIETQKNQESNWGRWWKYIFK